MKISFEKRLILFFTIIFIGIIILGFVAYKSNRTTLETNKLIAHTKEVIAESELVLSLSKDIVMGSQRYVITGDSVFLGHFSSSKDVVFAHIRKLKDLTIDNQVQQVRVDSLNFIIESRIHFSDLYVQVRNEKGFAAAGNMIATGQGKFYTDEVRDLINHIEGQENSLLIQREETNDNSIAAFNRAFYALLISVFLFLIVVFFYILENSKKRAKAEEQLRQSEKQIQAIFKGAPDAVIAIDSTGTIVNWNPKAEALFGWEANEVIGKMLSETIIPHRYREAHQKGMKHFLTTGEGPVLDKTIEIQAVNKSNIEFDVSLSISPSLIKDGYLFIGFIRDITEKKRMDEEMKQTNRFLDTILENIPNMIFVKDAEELRFIRFNKAGEQLLGYSRKDLIGKNDYDFFPKEQADFFTGKDRDVIKKGDLLDIPEEPINTTTGEKFLHTKKIPIIDEQGEPLYLLGISEDITEQKKVEQRMKELNEQFIKIFNLSPVAMSISNLDDGCLTNVNESFEKLFLIKKEQAIGKTFAELKIRKQEERTEIIQYLEKTGGHAREVEMQLRKADGEMIDALSSVETIEIGDKKLLLSAAMDISEQKKSEKRLKELNERFIKIFNLSPVSMSISNIDDGRFIMINEAFEKLFLFTHEEVIGKSGYDLKIIEHIEERKGIVETVQKEERFGKGLEMKIRRANGEQRDVIVTVEIVEIDNNKFLLSATFDITDRKKAEEEISHLNTELKKNLEQIQIVNDELEAFTYSVSHDLRSPLRIIDGYADIVIQDCKDKIGEEEKTNLNVIKNSAQKMGQLIDDLLSLSRLGRKELVIHIVNMNDLVDSVITEIRMDGTDASSHTEIKKEKLLPASCDKNLMKQVWSNLISNAIKYSRYKEKPLIEIGSYHEEKEIIYFVKDNGAGFDMQYADKLFGVFQRLHKITEFEGNGVGLAIVHRIITKHNGRVWTEAEVDKGATFYFSLPL